MSDRHYLQAFLSKIRAGSKLLLFELARHSDRTLRTIPIAPKGAGISVTHRCNSRCITCNMWRSQSTDELTTAELEDILTQLKAAGIVAVGLEGGEALLRNDLPQIVGKAHQLGFESISMMTNGLLLTRKKAEELIQAGLTGIGVSIDGIGERHDSIRGVKGAYARSLKALEELVNLRDTRYPQLDLHIGTILMRPTMDDIIPIIELAERLGVDFSLQLIDDSPSFFSGIDRASLWIEEQDKLDSLIDELHARKKVNSALKSCSHTRLEYARRYFGDPKQARLPCCLGYLTIYIDAHGEVYPGCFPLGSMGSLRAKSLKEIITSPEYKRRVQAMFHKECPGCACGYPSSLAYSLPALLDETLWRLKLRQ
ncbi:MAG: radical SAM protein [Chloroflexi bacterium]|nr:radical SAM protein [Chloroflexota bacterium]